MENQKIQHMEHQMFLEITDSVKWKKIEKIDKGWSSDEKYQIWNEKGEKFLLRVADIERYDAKKKEYDIIQKYAKTGIEMSMPLAFGICAEGKKVYMLLTWIEGKDLYEILPVILQKEQYELGRSAGEILRRIHSISIAEADRPEQTKRGKKLRQLEAYENSDVRIAGDERAVQYVKDHIKQIWSVEPVYQHGDFHPGNLIYMPSGKIGVIDFNRWEVGDPYEEFYKLESFGIECSIPYCVGEIDAYFNDHVPMDFWQVLAVYVAHASLYSIKWAEQFSQDQVEEMVVRCKNAFLHYDDFEKVVPSWYTQFQQKEKDEKEFNNVSSIRSK